MIASWRERHLLCRGYLEMRPFPGRVCLQIRVVLLVQALLQEPVPPRACGRLSGLPRKALLDIC
jgi:hypothetical protein